MKSTTTKVFLAAAFSIFPVYQASAWYLKLTNWASRPVNAHVTWAACRTDNVSLAPGQTVSINGKECLHTGVQVDGGTSYTSSGQRKYDQFYIIEVGKELKAGRIE